MRARLDDLLAIHFDSEFLTDPHLELDDSPAELRIGNETGRMVGNYRLVRRIGEGGFGTVYEAQQNRPVKRRVALKTIKLGMDTEQVIARFEAERQALSMMDHPGIAAVYDAGATHRGRPFFVMEFVEGTLITSYCDGKGLTVNARLDLFVTVCRAIEHAHKKGVIHRDLKPSNVLVTEVDGAAVAKVIDFGIAKAMQFRLTEETLMTRNDQFIGTPAYVSPEHLRIGGEDIDTRSDIYSLGVLLYEILAGATPFDSQQLFDGDLGAFRKRVEEIEPPKPSSRIASLAGSSAEAIAKRRSTSVMRLRQALSRELDWIVMKSMAKDRDLRYQGVAALREDIERCLANEPVLARPPAISYRASKFVRRNRRAIAIAALVGVVFLVSGLLVRNSMNKDRAEFAYRTLQSASSDAVAEAVADVTPYLGLLESKFRQELMSGSPAEKIRAAAALSQTDRASAGSFFEQILDEPASSVSGLLPIVEGIPSGWLEELAREVVDDYGESIPRRIRAATVLSSTGSGDDLDAAVVAEWLSAEPVLGPGFAKVANRLIPALELIYQRIPRGPAQVNAAQLLSRYLERDAGALAALVPVSGSAQFGILLEQLRRNRQAAIQKLFELSEANAEKLAGFSVLLETAPPTEDLVERCALQQSRAILALLQLGEPAPAWDVLTEYHPSDPRLRYFLIHGFAEYGVALEHLLRKLRDENSPSGIKQGILSALGDYNTTSLPEPRRQELRPLLVRMLKSDDPGVRAMSEWLCSTWGINGAGDGDGTGWRVNKIGMSLARFSSGETFLMGQSALAGLEFFWCQIPRAYELSMQPVRFIDFEKFSEGQLKKVKLQAKRGHLTQEHAVELVTLWEIRRFCNWLSTQDDIPPDQHCYETSDGSEGFVPKPGFLNLTGYRLPTDAEWENACRSGSQTRCFFGSASAIADRYARFLANSDGHPWPAGSLRPNPSGMFGILGNVFETVGDYSYDQSREQNSRSSPTLDDERMFGDINRFSGRGGTYYLKADQLNSGTTFRFRSVGPQPLVRFTFRVARTIKD